MTTTDDLVAEARECTGLHDLGSEHVLARLDAVVRDLDGPLLSERGRRIVRGMVVRTLERRLRLVDMLAKHPEIREVELPPVVQVSGLPRSGTTLLHNVLARHPRVRIFQAWELREPLPPPEAATYAEDPRIDAAAAALEPLRGTPLEHMHWVEPTDPEETQWALTDLHGLLGGGANFLLPNLRAVVADRSRSLVPTFTELRATLQLLLWRNPPEAGQVLVLKDPVTTAHLSDLVEVLGDPHVVVVHRDPYRVAVSAQNASRVVCAPLAANPNAVSNDVDWLVNHVAGMVSGLDAAAERAHHLAYPAVVADPVGAAGDLLDNVGLDGQDPAFVEAASDYLAWQRGGGRKPPPPAYDDLGLTREAVLGDPTVAAYVERFAVAEETRRWTGAG